MVQWAEEPAPGARAGDVIPAGAPVGAPAGGFEQQAAVDWNVAGAWADQPTDDAWGGSRTGGGW